MPHLYTQEGMENKTEPRVRSPEVLQSVIDATVKNGNREKPKGRGGIYMRFSRLKERGYRCCIPCLGSHNPLPENANFFQRVRASFLLPPHGNAAYYVQFVLICLQIWIVMYTLTRTDALLNGNLFSLLMLFIACVLGGYLISFIRLPPLLGMLIVGVMLRNVPGVKAIGEGIDSKWSGALRKIALTVILTRAGLGLDPRKLRKLSWAILRLAFVPCLSEAVTVGIVSHFLMGFPWRWSLMLGCILSALSPAVTVPALVNLQERRYGVAKGIPTMCLAAGGLDNVMCIAGFAIFLGTIFSTSDIAVTIIKGPLGVLLGIVYGFVMGFILWYLPAKDCSNSVFYRSLLLFGSGMVSVFGSSEIGLSAAGPLGCLTTATVAAYKWRQRRKPNESDEIANVMGLSWLIVQHFLFGLIGAAVNISDIQPSTAGLGIATLGIGLCVRSVISFTVTLGTEFNRKERIFVSLTWLSKATVQAAIGGMALDRALEQNDPDEEAVRLGLDILTLSVLAIVICAPLGATCMTLLGPRFLVKGNDRELEVKICNGEKEDLSKGKASIQNEKFKYENIAKDMHYNLDNETISPTGDILVENNQLIESYVHVNQAFFFDKNPVSTPKILNPAPELTTDTSAEDRGKNNSTPEPNSPPSTDVKSYIDKNPAENTSSTVSAQEVDKKDIDNELQISGNISEASITLRTSVESENKNIENNGPKSQVSYAEISLSPAPKCEVEEDTYNVPRKISVTLINVLVHNISPQHKS